MRHIVFQFLYAIYNILSRNVYRLRSRKSKFIDIYQKWGFGGCESASGPGSSLENTNAIRREIPLLIRDLKIKSLLDAPCGDFHWMKEVDLKLEKYTGIDIVPELIEYNRGKYGNESREFLVGDIVKYPLSSVDLILCRDCFIHLSFQDIFFSLQNFIKSNSRYLLTTTFPYLPENIDIITGNVRPVNLHIQPFNFPEPINLINEQYSEYNNKYSDKSLGLWKLSDIKKKLNIKRDWI